MPARIASTRQSVGALTQSVGRLRGIVRGWLAAGLRLTMRVRRGRAEDRRQEKARLELHALIRPVAPLPTMRDWAISPDLAVILCRLIEEQRPLSVLEAGSGVSSLILGYALKRQGYGQAVALEHLASYAATTRQEIARHGLRPWVQVRQAALTRTTIDGVEWSWYDPSAVSDLRAVDLVLVDGPPAGQDPLARYPLMPLIEQRLAPRVVIVLDDVRRAGEQRIVELWCARYPEFTVENVPTEKGTAIMRR